MADHCRFEEISSAEMDKLLDNSSSKSTLKATKYGMRLFDGKHLQRAEQDSEIKFLNFHNKDAIRKKIIKTRSSRLRQQNAVKILTCFVGFCFHTSS